MRHAYVIIALIFLTATGTATPMLDVSPETFEFDGHAGSTIERDVTVTWNGGERTAVFLSTDMTAAETNTTGIEADLSAYSFFLDPGESRTVTVAIDSHVGLVPDTFELDIHARANAPNDVPVQENFTTTVDGYNVTCTPDGDAYTCTVDGKKHFETPSGSLVASPSDPVSILMFLMLLQAVVVVGVVGLAHYRS